MPEMIWVEYVKRTYQLIILYSIAFSFIMSLLTGTSLFPGFTPQAIALSGYFVAILISHRIVVFSKKNSRRSVLLVLLVFIFLPGFISRIFEFSLWSVVRISVFIFTTYVFFVLYPNFVRFEYFALVTVIFATIATILAISSVFLGDYQLIIIDVNMAMGSGRISYLGFDIPEIRGIYISPNRFGFLAATGSFLSLYFINTNELKSSIIPMLLFSFNLMGLFLSGSRSSYLGISVAFGVLFAYYILRKPGLRIATLGVILSATGVTLGVLGYLPGWEGLGPGELTHRVGIWSAAISATLERPLTGWGFVATSEAIGPHLPEYLSGPYSTHNSYLRIFVSGGLISGVAYILFISAICYWGTNVSHRRDLFALCTATLLLTIHIFEIPTIFGPSMPSTLTGVCLGYIYFNNVDPIRVRNDYDRD